MLDDLTQSTRQSNIMTTIRTKAYLREYISSNESLSSTIGIELTWAGEIKETTELESKEDGHLQHMKFTKIWPL